MSNDADGSGSTGPPPPRDGYPPRCPGYPPPVRLPVLPAYPPPGYPLRPGTRPARLRRRPATRRRATTRRVPTGAAPMPALKPGIIPLRPLTLSDIYNGAVAYVRTNPKATLGLTAIVVVVAQVLALLPAGRAAWRSAGTRSADRPADDVSTEASGRPRRSRASVGVVATWSAVILLSGLLTVIVGRAVFGARITIGEAWQRARGRLLALLGLHRAADARRGRRDRGGRHRRSSSP